MKRLIFIFCAAALAACGNDDTGGNGGGGFYEVVRGTFSVAAGEQTTTPFDVNVIPRPQVVVFSSVDPDIFHVEPYTGVVTCLRVGSGTLSVKGYADDALLGEYTVTVTAGTDILVSELLVPSSFKVLFPDALDFAKLVTVRPSYALNAALRYEITNGGERATIDPATGVITPAGIDKLGAITVTVSTTDGSEITKTVSGSVVDERPREYTPIDRSAWTITTSHPTQTGDAASGPWQQMVDDPALNLCMGLGKPGRVAGINAPVWFLIDMGSVKQFNYFEILHRTGAYEHLSVWSADIEVSDNGVDFTTVIQDVNTRCQPWSNTVPVKIHEFGQTYSGRYFRFTYKSWNTTNGNYMQTNDFKLGTFVIP